VQKPLHFIEYGPLAVELKTFYQWELRYKQLQTGGYNTSAVYLKL